MLDSPGPEHTAVRRAVALTRERLADPLTLADVTARSPVARGRRDAAPYLTRLRPEEARRLLAGTDRTVQQVADRCGFSSPESCPRRS